MNQNSAEALFTSNTAIVTTGYNSSSLQDIDSSEEFLEEDNNIHGK